MGVSATAARSSARSSPPNGSPWPRKRPMRRCPLAGQRPQTSALPRRRQARWIDDGGSAAPPRCRAYGAADRRWHARAQRPGRGSPRKRSPSRDPRLEGPAHRSRAGLGATLWQKTQLSFQRVRWRVYQARPGIEGGGKDATGNRVAARRGRRPPDRARLGIGIGSGKRNAPFMWNSVFSAREGDGQAVFRVADAGQVLLVAA